MVPIVNKPCLGHIFELLKRHGIEDSFVTLQYLASIIQDSYGIKSTLSTQKKLTLPAALGITLRYAQPLTSGSPSAGPTTGTGAPKP